MKTRRIAGVAMLTLGVIGAGGSAWFISKWYLVNKLTWFAGPVYSSLILGIVILGGSLILTAIGLNAAVRQRPALGNKPE